MQQFKISKNEQKILNTLEIESRELSATELAELTRIDIKNLSKSTSKLIKNALIIERPEQNGKVRIKYYSINLNPPESKIESIPSEPADGSQDQEFSKPEIEATQTSQIEHESQRPSRKQKEITFERIEKILTDTKDHTNKYLRNVILKFEEWRLAPLIPGLSIKVEKQL